MPDMEINTLKTDIALIQKDIKQIERVFKKIDTAVDQMTGILKTIAVQENMLSNNDKRISNLETTVKEHTDQEELFRKDFNRKFEEMKDAEQKERERRHKELLESIEKINKTVTEKLENQDKRIQSLENWRWYVLGGSAVLIFILNKIPWSVFF